MAVKNSINLAGAPLSKTVLTAKSYRLANRWRDGLVITVVIAIALGIAVWFSVNEPNLDSSALACALAVVLALIFVCTLPVLRLTYIGRSGLRPATPRQLDMVAAAKDLSVVARYVAAIQEQGRALTRAEARAIAKYSAESRRRTAEGA